MPGDSERNRSELSLWPRFSSGIFVHCLLLSISGRTRPARFYTPASSSCMGWHSVEHILIRIQIIRLNVFSRIIVDCLGFHEMNMKFEFL